MTATAFIFLGFVIIIGAILVVRGLFMKQHYNDPSDKADGLMKIPQRFDTNIIERQIVLMEDSPDMIHAYINRLKTKFKLSSETQILDRYEQKYLAHSRVSEAQAQHIQSETRKVTALRDFKVAEADLHTVDKDIRIRNRERDVKEAELDERLINISKTSQSKPESKWDAYRQKQEDKLDKERIDREYKRKRDFDNLADELRASRDANALLKEEKRKLLEEMYPGKSFEDLTADEAARMVEAWKRLEDKIYNYVDQEE